MRTASLVRTEPPQHAGQLGSERRTERSSSKENDGDIIQNLKRDYVLIGLSELCLARDIHSSLQ